MRCEHFEVEGLARQEAGKPDPHVAGCTDCQASRATYRRMTDALADVGMQLYPKAGWDEEVLAKIEAPRRHRWWLGAGLGGVLVAAAIAALLFRDRPGADLQASIVREPSGAVVRGDDWAAGDFIVARSPIEGGAVWIYRGDELALTCDRASIAAPTCERDGAGVKVRFETLSAVYEVIAFDRPAPGAAPASLDLARALLIETDAKFEKQRIDVR